MPASWSSPLDDAVAALRKSIAGQVQIDQATRVLYSTDASIYQIEPLGVIFPSSLDDLSAAVEIAAHYDLPVLPRGAGSSLAGQAIGKALILDCSRHLHKQIEVNSEERTATLEAGVVLAALNHAAGSHGLVFGPDPASAERATIGGSLANNASGSHSILYGMAADHLLSAEVVLADGSLADFRPVQLEEAERRGQGNGATSSREALIYKAALDIRANYGPAIRDRWPKTWRRASGYNLNYLLPWSPSQPPGWSAIDPHYPPVDEGSINLAHLLAGSEGTLGIIRRATVRLVPQARHSVLAVLAYASYHEACSAVEALLEHNPSAVELIPDNLINLARSVPAFARQLTFLEQEPFSGETPAAILVIEFAGDDIGSLKGKAEKLGPGALIVESVASQRQIWAVRKVGLGLLMSRPGDEKPMPFVEDLSVPVDRLAEFVGEMERIMAEHGTRGDYYAHASAGCLHIRPLLNLKTTRGLASLRSIAGEAVRMTIRLGGAVSGEHGIGLARSEWLELAYGREVMAAFRELKTAADPQGILNPGKILDSARMDENLRVPASGSDRNRTEAIWMPVMDFSGQAGFLAAVEQCNGSGECRKMDGVMCPSFQATREEMHSTRGRANLLRALLTGNLPEDKAGKEILYEALDLCLACKGCKAECPSAVDMAKLKYEFLHRYYESRSVFSRRPARDYLFANIGLIAGVGQPFAAVANRALSSAILAVLRARLFGISRNRSLPLLNKKTLRQLATETHMNIQTGNESKSRDQAQPKCIFLSDPFTEHFQPEVGLAALSALKMAGYEVKMLTTKGSVRTLISKGFLPGAREQAARTLKAIERIDTGDSLPVVGVEPSEIYTLRDEFPDLLPRGNGAQKVAHRAFMIDELLVRPGVDGDTGILKIMEKRERERGSKATRKPKVFLHGHCYQKAQPPAADGYPSGVEATKKMLEAAGYEVSVIDSGCCGMAGAFGYESEHYDLSMKIGELALFPRIREARDKDSDVIIAAPGFSCQSQIKDGTAIQPVHPIQLV